MAWIIAVAVAAALGISIRLSAQEQPKTQATLISPLSRRPNHRKSKRRNRRPIPSSTPLPAVRTDRFRLSAGWTWVSSGIRRAISRALLTLAGLPTMEWSLEWIGPAERPCSTLSPGRMEEAPPQVCSGIRRATYTALLAAAAVSVRERCSSLTGPAKRPYCTASPEGRMGQTPWDV
jgi:hypothetical protein